MSKNHAAFLLKVFCCAAIVGRFTVPSLGATPSQSTKTIAVSAKSFGVNTGIHVQRGSKLHFKISGAWYVSNGSIEATSAAGNLNFGSPCPFGSLVGQVGFHYSSQIHCIGRDLVFESDRSGTLFLKSQDVNDLNHNEVSVEISGEIVESEILSKDKVAEVDLTKSRAEWVEIFSEHIQMTLPRTVVIKDQDILKRTLDLFDEFYRTHRSLSGLEPWSGEKIRFFPDIELTPGVFAYAWNPIRYSFAVTNFLLQDMRNSKPWTWGWVHELGHLFNIRPNGHHYAIGAAEESWANVFSVHAIEKLNLNQSEITDHMGDISWYFRDASYSKMNHNVALTMLNEIKEQCGWTAYHKMFNSYDNLNPDQIPHRYNAFEYSRWLWLAELFKSSSNCDALTIFAKYFVPLPQNYTLFQDLTPEEISLSHFRIRSLVSDLCLTQHSELETLLLSQTECRYDNYKYFQSWSLIRHGFKDEYLLKSLAEDKCLRFEGTQKVSLVDCQNPQATYFNVAAISDYNVVKLEDPESNLCMDVWQGNSSQGAQVTSYSCHGQINQSWSIEKIVN